MGAIIDPSNPIVPFVGGFIVGALVGAPIMEMIGGAIIPEADSSAAYAYHGRRMHGGHMYGGRGMGMRGHPMMMLNQFRAKPAHKDFEKEYMNVEQTYTNHIFINDRHSSV